MLRTSPRDHGMTRILILAIVVGMLGTDSRVPAQDASRISIDPYRDYLLKDSGEPLKDGAIRVTFLGTTTLLFDDGETQIMTDGFFTRPRMFTVATGRIQTDTKLVDAVLKKARIDRLKALFVNHSHYDHALDCAYVVRKTNAKLHGSASTLNIGRGGELGEDQMALFKPGKEVVVGKFTVTVREAKHTPPIKGVNDDLGKPIEKPLPQPAFAGEYKEGGSFDFLIRHGKTTIFVANGGNFTEGAHADVRADTLFLCTGGLGIQTDAYRKSYYDETVKHLRPKLVIPTHWDNFFKPLNETLEGYAKPIDDLPTTFDFLKDRLKADGIKFGLLQGYGSVVVKN